MKAVLQRVSSASVTVDGKVTGEIGEGLLILLGVGEGDTVREADILSAKIAELRIFCDGDGKMNLSVRDVDAEALVISNFTLYSDCKKGRRPSYFNAAKPEAANALYLYFTELLRGRGVRKVATGVFGAHMKVLLCNDGPVTIILDTDELR